MEEEKSEREHTVDSFGVLVWLVQERLSWDGLQSTVPCGWYRRFLFLFFVLEGYRLFWGRVTINISELLVRTFLLKGYDCHSCLFGTE